MINPVKLSSLYFNLGYSFAPLLCVIHHFSHALCDWSFPPSSAPHLKTFKVFLIFFSQCPRFITVPSCDQRVILKFKSNLPVKRFFFCWMLLLPWQCWYLILRVPFAIFVTVISKRTEIFHMLQFSLISLGSLEIFIASDFPTFASLHSIFPFQPIDHHLLYNFFLSQ